MKFTIELDLTAWQIKLLSELPGERTSLDDKVNYSNLIDQLIAAAITVAQNIERKK